MSTRQQLHQEFVDRFHVGDNQTPDTDMALGTVEETLGIVLPNAYRRFLETYGAVYTPGILDIVVLRNSRLNAIQQFHTTTDVIESSISISLKGCIAFASDCQGNYFCFKRLSSSLPAPDDAPVWLFDHETGKTSKVAPSFDTWLTQYTNLQPLLQDRSADTPTSTAAGEHQYQIVLQFPESFFADTAAILVFEEKLSSSMPRTQSYDGYDSGSGTINFFIYSNTPNAVLANFRKYLGTNKVEKKVRITYRDVTAETFTNLWPKRDTRAFEYSYN